MDFLVYIIYSKSIDRFYIGYTSDFENRINFHNNLLNKIWTKRGQPWSKYLIINQLNKTQALRIERHLKKMKTRNYLIQLNENPEMIVELKKRFG